MQPNVTTPTENAARRDTFHGSQRIADLRLAQLNKYLRKKHSLARATGSITLAKFVFWGSPRDGVTKCYNSCARGFDRLRPINRSGHLYYRDRFLLLTDDAQNGPNLWTGPMFEAGALTAESEVFQLRRAAERIAWLHPA